MISNSHCLPPQTIHPNTSNRIAALRFILASMVVLNHFDLESQCVSCYMADIANGHDLLSWGFRALLGLFGAAVPLFFLFSGYLLARKASPPHILLKKRARSLLLPFVLWLSICMVFFILVKPLCFKVLPWLIANPNASVLTYGPDDWVHGVLGRLAPTGFLSAPGFAYHLWFLRDLMVLVLVSPALVFCVRRFPSGFLCLLFLLYLPPLPVWIVDTQSLFFFSLGLYWGVRDYPLFDRLDGTSALQWVFLFALALFLAESLFRGHGAIHWFMVLFSCVLFLKSSSSLVKGRRFLVLKRLGGFSFFLYMVHAPILNVTIQKVWEKTCPAQNAWEAFLEWFGTGTLTIALGTAIGLVLKRIFPAVFSLLNGGRN